MDQTLGYSETDFHFVQIQMSDVTCFIPVLIAYLATPFLLTIEKM